MVTPRLIFTWRFSREEKGREGIRAHSRSIRKRNASQLFPPPLPAGSPVSFMDRSQWWFYAAIEDACLRHAPSRCPFLATSHSVSLSLSLSLSHHRSKISLSLSLSAFLVRPRSLCISLFSPPASVLPLVKYVERVEYTTIHGNHKKLHRRREAHN